MPENDVYRFGVFELDSRTRELKKHGVRVKLQDQPLRILLLLVQHPGEVVTREQIQSELWPAGTYVDYENAINNSVRKLREALGDNPTNPRFIETLSRRGYRFLLPVPHDGEGNVAPAPPATTRRRRWPVLTAAGVLVVVIIAGFLVNRYRSASRFEFPPAVPLTSYPGQTCCPSFSPDGTRVAFAWSGPSGDNLDIYIKLIGQGEPVRLTTDTAEHRWPAWSPDGKSIAFVRYSEGVASVMVVPALGGPDRVVTRLGTGELAHYRQSFISWSADGKSLFGAERSPGAEATWITRISVESGEKTRISFPPDGYDDGDPAVSPDGKNLAFTRGFGFTRRNICVLSLTEPQLSGRNAKRLTPDASLVDSMAWTPDSRELVFSAERTGGHALWRVAADGSSPPALLTGGENRLDITISPQGRLIYCTGISVGPSLHLWRVALGGAAAARPFLPSTRQQFLPQYSPDGKRVAFQSDRSGNHEVWVSNEDGSAPVQLTFFGTWSGSPRWSPDGNKIAFASDISGNWRVYVVGSQGGKPVQLTSGRPGGAIPSWSRDGKWIYFPSSRTGRDEIWKIPVAGGGEVQVTRNGGVNALESASGRELYFTKSASIKLGIENGLWRMALPDGIEERVAGPITGRNFETGARGVYFIQESRPRRILRFLPYAGGSAVDILSLEGTDFCGLTVSPDERVAVYSRADETNAELMLVDGFWRKRGP